MSGDWSAATFAAARAETLDEIGEHAFLALARALDATPSFLAVMERDLSTARPLAGAHRSLLLPYLHAFADDPLLNVFASLPASVFALEDHVDRSIVRSSRAYLEFHERHDMEHHMVLRAALGVDRDAHPFPARAAARTIVMGFTRGKRQRAFDRLDVERASVVQGALRGTFERLTPRNRWDLTPAEARVMTSLMSGASNAEIARELHVSIETIKTHVQRILRKLGVGSRARAIAAFKAQE